MERQESDVIEGMQKGEESAFKMLVEMNQTLVYNTSLYFLKNIEDAEDSTQEVFVHIYQKFKSFKQDSKLSTWIYKITVNKALEKIRSQSRQKRKGIFVSFFNKEDEKERNLISDFEHPGIILENKEKANTLMLYIDKLPERQKVAFTLSKMEDLGNKEIADIMELSISSVESLIFRAKSNLKDMLEVYYKNRML